VSADPAIGRRCLAVLAAAVAVQCVHFAEAFLSWRLAALANRRPRGA